MFLAIKKIHMVGIGGSGMSGIAEILHNLGYEVSGSDIKSSPLIEKLIKSGIKIYIGHDANNLKDSEVLVYSSAVHKSNPELIEAQNNKIPIIHRSEMLAELMRLKTSIAVSGTHGKTTTTSILASSLHYLHMDPTVIIGGKINTFDGHSKIGKGDLFVAEADESDGSFLKLNPTIAIVTNIDRDHLDHYENLDNIIKTFELFLNKVPFYGALCLCIDDPIVQVLLPQLKRKIITFGLRHDADIYAKNIQLSGFHSTYTPIIFGKKYHEVHLKMPGQYNIVNSLATFAIGHLFHINPNETAKSISHFEGVEHRFTLIGEINNAIIVDDYAHNPKKIQTVLSGARESFPNKHIIAIFQPHRYTRIKYQMDEFSKCFKDADDLIITPIYTAGEQAIPNITIDILAHMIKLGSFDGVVNAIFLAENFQLAIDLCVKKILEEKYKEFIVISLGAGDIKNIGPSIFQKLKENQHG